jgi:hypothetical protein
VIRALGAGRLRVPVSVVRTPALPAFAGPDTLVVASSYSGDTAETLGLFEHAVRRGCRIVAVTAGGELSRRAEELALHGQELLHGVHVRDHDGRGLVRLARGDRADRLRGGRSWSCFDARRMSWLRGSRPA